MLDKPRRAEQDAIDPPFERSLELLARIAAGRLQDAMTWLHTSPEDEARRQAAREARLAQRAQDEKDTKEPKP